MEKGFKYFILIATACMFIGVFIAMNMPKPSMSIHEEMELRQAVTRWNSDLPRTIGTIGTMDSITYHDKTITYNITVFGDNAIKQVYRDNYEEFKGILKYSILAMNGQRNMGNVLVSFCDRKEINLGFRVFTQDGDATDWKMPGRELKQFVESCKVSPTTALKTTVDLQIEIANLHLPVRIEDIHDPIKSVALNAILGELDESCLPQAITHVGDDIDFVYNVDEKVINLNDLENVKDNMDAIEALASTFTEDADTHEFLGIIAISHSNMILTYKGRKSGKEVSIRIPYSILKKYCKVPQYLLS